jgi:hypothetical protein
MSIDSLVDIEIGLYWMPIYKYADADIQIQMQASSIQHTYYIPRTFVLSSGMTFSDLFPSYNGTGYRVQERY